MFLDCGDDSCRTLFGDKVTTMRQHAKCRTWNTSGRSLADCDGKKRIAVSPQHGAGACNLRERRFDRRVPGREIPQTVEKDAPGPLARPARGNCANECRPRERTSVANGTQPQARDPGPAAERVQQRVTHNRHAREAERRGDRRVRERIRGGKRQGKKAFGSVSVQRERYGPSKIESNHMGPRNSKAVEQANEGVRLARGMKVARWV